MNWQMNLTPWNIAGAVFGFFLGVAALVGLVMNHHRIRTALARTAQRLFSPVGFFGLVIVVFMIISVLESGQFFNDDITHGAIFGLLGYALALGFDLVSIVCMQARLNATRMRDDRGANLNLVGVCICAAVSAFANVAGALQGYHPANLDHTPAWIQFCAPWTSMVFPLLIVVLSMTTDHILDHTPARGIDITVFRERERKRVEMLQVRLETERELLTLDTELSTLRHNREQASGRVQREWIIWRWLRPAVPPPANVAKNERTQDLTTAIDQAVQTTQAALQERFDEVNASLHTLSTRTTEANELLSILRIQVNTGQEQGNMQIADRKQRAGGQHARPPARLHAHHTQGAHPPERPRPEEATGSAEGANAAEYILAAFQRLGMNATDTAIAHEVGYSRTTVARWKKRLAAQGRLSSPAERAQFLQRTEPAE